MPYFYAPSHRLLASFLFFTSLLLTGLTGHAQDIPPIRRCAADEAQQIRMDADPAYKAFVLRARQAPTNKVNVNRAIPVVFVVYHLGEAVGTGTNLSDAVLQTQLARMNQVYAAQGNYSAGFNTQIQFVLAQRSPTCTAINGIIRYNAGGVSGYSANGITSYGDGDNLAANFPEYANTRAEQFITIRVVTKMTGGLNGVGGFASAGGDIFVRGDNTGLGFTGLNYELLAHEMGHILNLPHTFEGSVQTSPGVYSCPPNANPSSDGDGVADTDPHKYNDFTCSASDVNACTGQPFGNLGINVMNYACDRIFTAGQTDRMQTMLAGSLINLSNSNAATPPAANEALTAAGCTPATGYGGAYYNTGISRFVLNTIDHSTSVYVFPGQEYSDNSCALKTTVTAGNTYPIQIQTAFTQNSRIYIDYNNDGSFNETNEKAFATTNAFTGNVTIPTSVVTNTYLRVRVVSDLGNNATLTACLLPGDPTYGSGEAADYAVLIQPASCVAPSSPTMAAGPVAYCQGNGYQTSVACPVGSTAVLTSGPGSLSAGFLSLTATTAGTYSLSVVCSAGAGCNSNPRGIQITLNPTPTTVTNSLTAIVNQTVSLTTACSTGTPTWSTGQTVSTLMTSFTVAGTNSLTATCPTVCGTRYVYSVTVSGSGTTMTPASPTITLSSQTVCQGGTLSASVVCGTTASLTFLSTNITGTFVYTAVCSVSGVTGSVASVTYIVNSVPGLPTFGVTSFTVSQNAPLSISATCPASSTLVAFGGVTVVGNLLLVSTSTLGFSTYSVFCQTANCISPVVSISVTVVVTPTTGTLAVSPTSLTTLSQGFLTQSVFYTVNANGLNNPIVITAPPGYPGYYIRLGGTNNGYSKSLNLPATTTSQQIEVYYYGTNTEAAGALIGQILHESGTLTAIVNLTNTITGPPILAVSPGSLNFTTTVGIPSAPQAYTITTNSLPLTGGYVVPNGTGFEISLSASGPFTNGFLTLPPNTTSHVVYIRLTGAAIGPVSGSLTHWNGGTADYANPVLINGTVFDSPGTQVLSVNPVGVTSSTSSVTNYCSGQQVGLFYIEYNINAGNVTTVQLSDAAGSFATPSDLLVSSPYATAISSRIIFTNGVYLPTNLPAGTGYRLRILSSNPARTGPVFSQSLTINPTPAQPTFASNLTVLQNGSLFLLNTAICSGTLVWGGTAGDATTGFGVIPVATTQAGVVSYSAQCRTSTCNSPVGVVSVTVIADTPPPAPTMTLSSTAVCQGSPLSALVVCPAGPSSFTLNTNTTGTFTVTAVCANGATVGPVASVTYTVNPLPSPGLMVSNGGVITCANPSVTLTASGGTVYTFSGPGLSQSGSSGTALISQAGTYSLTVTNSSGCSSGTTITVTSDGAVPIISGFIGGTLTCAQTSLTLTASATGSSTLVYAVSGPGGFAQTNTTDVFGPVSSPGVYSLIVSSSNGCSAVATTTVGSNTTPPGANLVASGTLTCSVTAVLLTASGGGSYVFSGPAGLIASNPASSTSATGTGGVSATAVILLNNMVSVSAGGSYSVLVTGANGCTASATTTVSQDIVPPTASLATNGTLTCANPSVTLTASGGSGPPGVSYRFTGPGLSQNSPTTTAVVSQPGVYNVTVTGGNGCVSSTTVLVTSNTTPPAIVAFAPSGTLTCAVVAVNLSVTATGQGSLSYMFGSPGGGITNNGTNNVFGASTAGIYSVTVTDAANGCTASATTTVNSNTAPPTATLTPNSSTLTCANPSVTLTASGGAGYVFTGPGIVSSAGNSAVVNQPGTYSVVVTGTNGCTALATTTVTSNTTPPAANLVASGTLTCSVTAVLLTASGGTSYVFSGPAGVIASNPTSGTNSDTGTGGVSVTTVSLLSNMVSVSAGGSYSVVVTGSNGCTASATTTVNQNVAPPTASLATNGTLTCANPTVTLTASGGVSYRFTGPGLSQNGPSPTVVVSQTGVYSVLVTGANGCTATSSTVVTTNTNDLIQVSLSVSGTATCAQAATLTATSNATTFVFGSGATQIGNTNQALVRAAGIYSVTAISTGGCQNSAMAIVSEDKTPPTPTLLTSGTITCTNLSATLTATGGVSYAIQGPGLNQSGAANVWLVSQPGLYSLTATAANGCTALTTATVLENRTLPTATLISTNNINCLNSDAILIAGTGVRYFFTGPGLSQNSPGNTALVQQPGLYSVQVTGSNGCVSTATTTVLGDFAPPVATLQASGPIGCTAPTVTLTASGGGTYLFNGQTNQTGLFTVNAPGTYTVVVTGSNGCTASATATVTSDVSVPTASLVVSGSITCTNPTALLMASGGSGSPGVSYSFSGNGLSQSGSSSTALVSQAGTYSVVVTGANGCTVSTSVSVTSNQTFPEIGVSGSTTFCEGQSTQLTVTGNETIRWSTGATTPTVSISANGIYSVTLTGSNGCVAVGSRLVTAVSCATVAPATPTPTGCGSPTNTIGQPLVITGVTNISCVNGTFRILTTGGNGQAINFAGIVGLSNTSPFNCMRGVDGPDLVAAINNPNSTIQSFTLHGSQVEGGASTRFVFDFKQACTGTISTTTAPPSTTVAPPTNPTPTNCGSPAATLGGSVTITGVTDISCATGTFRILTTGGNGQAINFALIPGLAINDPYNCVRGVDGANAIAAINNPNSTIQPFGLRGMQINGGVSNTFMFDFKAACAGTPGSTTTVPPSTTATVPPTPTPTSCGSPTSTIGQPLVIINVADVNCVAGTFRILTTGGNGLPINFAGIVGLISTSPYDCVRQLESGNRAAILDPNSNIQSFTLLGMQVGGGLSTPFSFNFKQFCTGVARQAQTESVPDLTVTVLGNPTLNDRVIIEVQGAGNEPVTLRVSTVQGQPVSNQTVLPVAGHVRQSVDLGQSGGVYLLRVSTPTRAKTVKVVRQ